MKELSYLNKYLYKYRYRLLAGFVFVALSNWFGVFPAQIVRIAFDLIRENISIYQIFNGFQNQSVLYPLLGSVLLFFAIAVLLLSIIKGIFMFFMRQTIIVVSRLIEYDLKNEIYNHYQELSLAFFRRNNTGDLMNRVTEDVSRVRTYLGPAIMYTVNLIVLFILVVMTMIQVNPVLTFYSLLPLPFLFLAIYYVQNIINKKGEEIQEQLSGLSTFVQEVFSGIRVIKSFAREEKTKQDFKTESLLYKKKAFSLVQVESMFYPLMMLLIGLSILLTVYIGGQEAIQGRITAGNIAEFIVYVNMLTWPVASVGWVTTLVQRAAASQKRINEFLQTQPEIRSVFNPHQVIEGEIKFNDVSFTYPDTGIRALDHVSFHIEKGKTLAIIGKTGSGKSTIAHLLLRLFDPDSGHISVDGKPLNSLDLSALRKAIGFVPQEVFLFSDTIANNISFGSSSRESSAIIEAAKNAAVYDNITGFPQGFETLIGERGITLSGGQKQRVSIARALMKDPQILIFDDCLSAVDTKTEEEILRNLGEIMKGKTSLIISHRISAVKNAHQILVLDKGCIVEQGSHESLIKQKGKYFELYEKQLLEESYL